MKFEEPQKLTKENIKKEELGSLVARAIEEARELKLPPEEIENYTQVVVEAFRESERIGLSGEQKELYIEIIKRSAHKGLDEPRFMDPFDDVETERDIYDLAAAEIEDSCDFNEVLDTLEYYGDHPKFFSAERRGFIEVAKKTRQVVEEEIDPSLPPFDPQKEFKKFRDFFVGDWNPELIKEIKDDFERDLSEQKEGIDHLRKYIHDGILEGLQISAGISFGELKMIAENPGEYAEFMRKRGLRSLAELFRPDSEEKFSFEELKERIEGEKERLKELIKEKKGIYRLTDDQVKELIDEMGRLMDNRFQVSLLRSKFLNDDELFEEVTGNKPKGVVEVIENPFSLYFRCESEEDFAYFLSKKVSSKGGLEERDIRQSDQFKGRAVFSGGIYTAEKNTDKQNFDRHGFMLSVHEDQHAKDYLLVERGWPDYRQFLIDASIADGFIGSDQEVDKEDKEGVREKVIKGLRQFREFGERRVISEINAHLEQGWDVETFFKGLKKEKELDGLYDYFNKKFREGVLEDASVNIGSLLKEEIRDIINKVLVEEYSALLDDAQKAIEILEENDFSRNKIVILFQNISLGGWLTEAKKRIKNKKTKKNRKRG